jgi:hypothetical protein
MTAPPLAERQKPGLSETLRGPKLPRACQHCGGGYARGAESLLRRWRECDEWDRPTATIVILCRSCSDELIEAHPRLYIELDPNEPCPGAMEICLDCPMRDGIRCTSPLSLANGGPPPGMEIRFAKPPVRAHFKCSRPARSGWRTLYSGPPIGCAGKDAAAGTTA